VLIPTIVRPFWRGAVEHSQKEEKEAEGRLRDVRIAICSCIKILRDNGRNVHFAVQIDCRHRGKVLTRLRRHKLRHFRRRGGFPERSFTPNKRETHVLMSKLVWKVSSPQFDEDQDQRSELGNSLVSCMKSFLISVEETKRARPWPVRKVEIIPKSPYPAFLHLFLFWYLPFFTCSVSVITLRLTCGKCCGQ
jgi:hypothetical protein